MVQLVDEIDPVMCTIRHFLPDSLTCVVQSCLSFSSLQTRRRPEIRSSLMCMWPFTTKTEKQNITTGQRQKMDRGQNIEIERLELACINAWPSNTCFDVVFTRLWYSILFNTFNSIFPFSSKWHWLITWKEFWILQSYVLNWRTKHVF